MNRLLLNSGIALMFLAANVETGSAQIREIANPGMAGIAKVTRDQSGRPVIMYNPTRCAQMGQACLFFRAHELAHIQLNHMERRTPEFLAELEADCWAARNVSPSTLNSAVRWFNAGNSPHVHGTGPQRAVRITACGRR